MAASGHKRKRQRSSQRIHGEEDQEHDAKIIRKDGKTELRTYDHPQDRRLWQVSYERRALLTKMKGVTFKQDNYGTLSFDLQSLPKQIKFVTVHPDDNDADIVSTSTYGVRELDLMDSYQEYQFIEKVKNVCQAFDFNLTVGGEQWDQMFQTIEKYRFCYSNETNSWSRSSIDYNDMEDLPDNLKSLACSLDLALQVNLLNGKVKDFINDLLESVQLYANVGHYLVHHESPVIHTTTNGRIQLVDPGDSLTWENDEVPPDIDEVRGGRLSDQLTSLNDSMDHHVCSTRIHQRVPDHIWYLHKYPGYFVLNVECKSERVASLAARMQCIHQMLTQMHFQKSAFGLLIHNQGWYLLFVSKSGDRIRVYQMNKSFLDENEDKFDVESLKCLCSWLYRILDYRMNCFAG